ncbi:antirestriction protein [Proteus mirabilis]|uniref:Antirestriction protein n=1 Tax=Proteus mirabilis TaxID=584 RepID=A0ABD5LTC6_PROMI
MCEVYHGAFWEFSMLSNGGAFIWPDMLQNPCKCLTHITEMKPKLSPEAAGTSLSNGV